MRALWRVFIFAWVLVIGETHLPSSRDHIPQHLDRTMHIKCRPVERHREVREGRRYSKD